MKCLKDKKTGKLSFKVKKGKKEDKEESKDKDDKKNFPWKK